MRRLVFAFLLLFSCGPAWAGQSDAALDVLERVNQLRRDYGLPPVKLDERLAQAAQNYAQELAQWGQLSHHGPKGSDLNSRLEGAGYPYRLAAENLASGLIGPDKTVDLWLESPGHRRNMLLPELHEAGVGLSQAPDGQSYWTLVLGRRMNDRAEQPDYDLGP